MGQHQETMTGRALRRIILVLAVAAVMATMMAVTALPAMAKNSGTENGGPPNASFGPAKNDSSTVFHGEGGVKGTCVEHFKDGERSKLTGGGAPENC